MRTFLCICFLVILQNNSNAQWIQTAGPECGFAYDFESLGQYIFVSSEGNGVFRSSNGGNTWTNVSFGLPKSSIQNLAVIGTTIFAGTIDGVYKSDNNGLTWIPANSGISGISIISFATDGAYLFAGSDGYGIFVTDDNGTSWTQKNNGLGDLYIKEIEINSAGMYVGTYSGTYRSTTNGNVWNLCANNVVLTVATAFVSIGTTVYASDDNSYIYVTNDTGATWTQIGSGLPWSIGVEDLFESAGTLFAATAVGIYKSADFGITWIPTNNSIIGNVNHWKLFKFNGKIFTGTFGGGIYSTDDNGLTWVESNNGYIDSPVYDLVNHQNQLFAATWGGGIFTSTDQGITWSPSNSGITGYYVNELFSSGNELYCVVSGILGNKIFRSINNGASWTDLQLALIWNVSTIFQHSGALYVGTGNMGVYKSVDGGLTWSNVSIGITPNVRINRFISIGNYLFAATNDGVFVTTNNGANWTSTSNGLNTTYIQSLTVNGNSLFAGSSSGGVFKTTNFGTSWTNVNNGLLSTFNLTVETVGSSIIAGYYDGLIYISNDDGLTWNNKDLPTTNFGSKCFAVDGNTIYVGTEFGGVFKDSTFASGISSPETSVKQIAAFPNPASDLLELSISQKLNSSSQYEISNIVGQVLKTIQIDKTSCSNTKVRIDISDLPSGYYIISDKNEKGVSVKFVKL